MANRTRLLAPVLLALAGSAESLYGQGSCVSDLASEIRSFETLSASIVDRAFAPAASSGSSNSTATPSPSEAHRRSTTLIRHDSVFLVHAALSGSGRACLLNLSKSYRDAALAALALVPADSFDVGHLRGALAAGAGAVLGQRYTPTDRFGIVFGIGVVGLITAEDRTRYKTVSRTEDGETTQYIVVESDSKALPSAVTGLVAEVRDRGTLRYTYARVEGMNIFERFFGWTASRGAALVDVAFPTAVYTSVQFGSGASGPIQGVSLGGGWRLVEDLHLLGGVAISRLESLRKDVRAEFDANPNGRFPVPPGESLESLQGTITQAALLVAVSVPVSFRGRF